MRNEAIEARRTPMSESPGDACRRLTRATDRAVLSTILAETGEPYASLVLLACTQAAEPLLLLSDLADHTKNLKAEPRASILLDGTGGLENPLTGARASLQGPITKIHDPEALARFVRRHPSAGLYASFGDFNLYRMAPERAHLVAGFGRIHWTTEDLVVDTDGEALGAQEDGVVAHMNEDHCDAVGLYANRILGLAGVGWRLTGVDPEGCDLRRGGGVARIDFTRRVQDAEGARAELVKLVKRARSGS
jgi:putative heme iron utilization protein